MDKDILAWALSIIICVSGILLIEMALNPRARAEHVHDEDKCTEEHFNFRNL